METLRLSDRQGTEICDNVGRLLASELDTRGVRSKVERAVSEYLKEKRINIDTSEITSKLDWSVNVRLKK